jgi:hypothetical protein
MIWKLALTGMPIVLLIGGSDPGSREQARPTP